MRFLSKAKNAWLNNGWLAFAPKKLQPGYGKAAKRNVRLNALDPIFGPKADVKAIFGAIGDVLSNVPQILESAGAIGKAIGTQGATSAEAIDPTIEALKDLLNEAKGIVKKGKARAAAANAIVSTIITGYRAQLMAASPWVVRDGKLDMSKTYLKDPRTYGDLAKRGNAYPILWIPPA